MVSSVLTISPCSAIQGQHIYHQNLKGSARPLGLTHKSHTEGVNRGRRADLHVDRAEKGIGFLSKLLCFFFFCNCAQKQRAVSGWWIVWQTPVTWDAVMKQYIQLVLKLPNGKVLKLFFNLFSVCFIFYTIFQLYIQLYQSPYKHISLVSSNPSMETLIILVNGLPAVRTGPQICWHVNTLGSRYPGICHCTDTEAYCLLITKVAHHYWADCYNIHKCDESDFFVSLLNMQCKLNLPIQTAKGHICAMYVSKKRAHSEMCEFLLLPPRSTG